MIDQNVNIPVSTVFDRPRQILRSMRWVTSAFAYPGLDEEDEEEYNEHGT